MTAITTEPSAPTPVSHLIAELTELEGRLRATDLNPSAEVNGAFTRLVDLCTVIDDTLTQQLLDDAATEPLISSLRSLSCRGESALERAWSRRLIQADDPNQELEDFPYLDNYRRLVRFELAALNAVGAPHPRSATVLGAGPLPLTGVMLARHHNIHITNVDSDPEACELASAACEALGLSDRIQTVRGDAGAPAELESVTRSELVLLAALVGEDSATKRSISRELSSAMRPDGLLLARSAHRLRTALYPPVSPDDLSGFRPLVEMHPCDDVVNSLLLARAESP